ncbi:MAG TPA: P-type conjugative transfer protein TrbG [Sphingomicrobium sp.]|nr:P-type conjugative transfer protein TrbG [Sphingomicrobium sp.]
MSSSALLSIVCVLTSGTSASIHAAAPAMLTSRQFHVSSAALRTTHKRSKANIDTATALGRVEQANRIALTEPSSSLYVGAVQVYPWTEGSIFRLYTAPGEVSDIELEAGETLSSVAAGDTVRWIISNTVSGSGTTRRSHVLVKPSAAGLATNLVIATDRRVYHVGLTSNAKAAMPGISWSYPEDALLALKIAPAPAAQPAVAPAMSVERLNFDYRIEGDSPEWRPVRAFDDGTQVFIEFPPEIAEAEAPPLFIVGADGKAELVNYRLHGRYYVVDRLFRTAELRLGEKHQAIVRIVRQGPRASRRAA